MELLFALLAALFGLEFLGFNPLYFVKLVSGWILLRRPKLSSWKKYFVRRDEAEAHHDAVEPVPAGALQLHSFSGRSKDGTFVSASLTRTDGGDTGVAELCLSLPGIPTLVCKPGRSPCIQSTSSGDQPQPGSVSCGGLTLKATQAAYSWTLSFSGTAHFVPGTSAATLAPGGVRLQLELIFEAFTLQVDHCTAPAQQSAHSAALLPWGLFVKAALGLPVQRPVSAADGRGSGASFSYQIDQFGTMRGSVTVDGRVRSELAGVRGPHHSALLLPSAAAGSLGDDPLLYEREWLAMPDGRVLSHCGGLAGAVQGELSCGQFLWGSGVPVDMSPHVIPWISDWAATAFDSSSSSSSSSSSTSSSKARAGSVQMPSSLAGRSSMCVPEALQYPVCSVSVAAEQLAEEKEEEEDRGTIAVQYGGTTTTVQAATLYDFGMAAGGQAVGMRQVLSLGAYQFVPKPESLSAEMVPAVTPPLEGEEVGVQGSRHGGGSARTTRTALSAVPVNTLVAPQKSPSPRKRVTRSSQRSKTPVKPKESALSAANTSVTSKAKTAAAAAAVDPGRLCVGFEQLLPTDVVGGKAKQLNKMACLVSQAAASVSVPFAVPPGFFITAAALAQQMGNKSFGYVPAATAQQNSSTSGSRSSASSKNSKVNSLLKDIEGIAAKAAGAGAGEASAESAAALDSQLEKVCSQLAAAFEQMPMDAQLQQYIEAAYASIPAMAGSNANADAVVAVRSSGIDEDTGDSSAAGQLETFLGVSGLDGPNGVLLAVKKCWASCFNFRSVKYRISRSQPVVSTMGVVVQRLVDADTAGVMFSANPVTKSLSEVVINANYGIGESVVSGIASPDTFVVARPVPWLNAASPQLEPEIVSTDIGSKELKVVAAVRGGRATKATTESVAAPAKTVPVPLKDRKVACLDEDAVKQLAVVAEAVVDSYGGEPQDMEWGIKDGVVYLLQVRPITTLVNPVDTAVHEFDSPRSCDNEVWTTCNIGEMCPGPWTPLTQNMLGRGIELGLQDLLQQGGALFAHVEFHLTLARKCGTTFINLSGIGRLCTHVSINDKRTSDLSLLGRVLESHSVEDLFLYHGQPSSINRFLYGISFFSNLRRARNRMLECVADFDEAFKHKEQRQLGNRPSLPEKASVACIANVMSLEFDKHELSVGEAFRLIFDAVPEYYRAWSCTIAYSSRSGSWATALMMILSGGKNDWNTSHYSDLASLLAHCGDVESGDVPQALEKLGEAITNQSISFESMPLQDAYDWLTSPAAGAAQAQFAAFLKRHGHRCIREAEVLEKAWVQDPVGKLMPIMQSIVQQRRSKATGPIPPAPPQKDDETIFAELKSPVTAFGMLILRRLLPLARTAVGQREWGKSMAVRSSHVFKTALWHLSERMEAEGLLPQGESDLMFFLTLQEIGILVGVSPTNDPLNPVMVAETQASIAESSSLHAQARNRKKALQLQQKIRFPDVSFVDPTHNASTAVLQAVNGSFQLSGMPVSQGVVVGPARIVTQVEDAGSIKAGEILICPYTDVGWTPYFNLALGLVTELGGLLSHGAVVAREFGLPCVVNARDACSLFKNGDIICLDGGAGTITRVDKR